MKSQDGQKECRESRHIIMATCFAIYQSRFILTAHHNHISYSLNAHNLHTTQEYCVHHMYTYYKNHHNYVKVSFK
jgi:hypothetical protein